jgi:hypothetical protein
LHVLFGLTFGSLGYQITSDSTSYCILGCYSVKGGFPIYVEANTNQMILHEFSHTFVNNAVNKIDIDENWISKIFDALRDDYRQQYGNGKGMISEQIVRAITARLVSFLNIEKANLMVDNDESESFILVRNIYHLLEEGYEKNRSIYPLFSNYLEILLNRLY